MTIKVGVQGRVILGPMGTPGQVDVPLRYAVVREGPEPKTIATKFKRVPVTVAPGETNVECVDVEEGMTFPMPSRSELDAYVIYVGFDEVGDKNEKPDGEKREEGGRRVRPNSVNCEAGYQPRRLTTVLFRWRRSATIVRAPAAISCSPRAALRMAAADKSNRRHSRRGGGSHAGRRVLDHDTIRRPAPPSGQRHEGTGRAPACRSARRWPENSELEEPARSVVSRLIWTRSFGADEATHFGPRSQVSAWAACGMARSSAREALDRRGRDAPRRNPDGKCGRVAASRVANMSAGRRPKKYRSTVRRSVGMPIALNRLRRDRSRDLLAVDQHAVAIEDDHGNRAPAPAHHRQIRHVRRIAASALEISAASGKIARGAPQRILGTDRLHAERTEQESS